MNVSNQIHFFSRIHFHPFHPSCLIYGVAISERVIHVVAGCDDEYAYIITAYYPSTDKFEADLKTRKG